MKKMNVFGTIFIMAVLMLASCLEEGTDSETRSDIGVIGYSKTSKKVMYLSENECIYSEVKDSEEEAFSDYEEGDCCYATFAYDGNDPANSSSMLSTNGYYTVKVLENKNIDQYNMLSGLTDTSKLLLNETAITNALYEKGGRYVKGRLFIKQQINSLDKQQTSWNLSYDPDFDNIENETDGHRIYDVFLRATIESKGTTGTSTAIYPINAYNISDYYKKVANIEKELGNDTIHIRFNYVSAIDTTKNSMTWKQSDGLSLLVKTILPEE